MRRRLTELNRQLQRRLFQRAFKKYAVHQGTALVIGGDDFVSALLKDGKHKVHTAPGAKKLPFPDHAFDYTAGRGLLETMTLEEIRRVIHEMLRVTRDLAFLHVRVHAFSPLNWLAGTFFPQTLPAAAMSVKEIREAGAGDPSGTLLQTFRTGWYEQGAVLLVIQKK